MSKTILFALICFCSPPVFAQDEFQYNLVWSGETNNPTYRALKKRNIALKVRNNDFSQANEVLVRSTSFDGLVEIKNRKSNSWVQMKVPAEAMGQVDVENFSVRAFEVSNCDEVKTIIDLKESTPKAEIHFNSKPIGKVKDNGRFYYESGAVCRNDNIELLGTLKNCKDFAGAFKAENNPHKYEGKAILICGKQSASK